MIIFSARNNFWNSDNLSLEIEDAVSEVDLETGQKKDDVTKNDVFSSIENKKVLILVHGYNSEKEEVIGAYSLIEKHHNKIWKKYDQIIGYIWPGGNYELDYFSAKNRSGAVSHRFKVLLKEMLTHCNEVGIMGHSLGCRVLLKAVDILKESGYSKTANMELYLTAAAVDNESLEKGERYFEATEMADMTYVFHSKNDPVLSFAYRLVEWDRALGLSGPENPAETLNVVKVVNCKKRVKKHGDYKRCEPLFEYLTKELSGSPSDKFTSL